MARFPVFSFLFYKTRNRGYFTTLYEAFGVRANNPVLYELAFTHRSASTSNTESNERLEFLGDAVINTIVSEYLFANYPDYDEGHLSKFRSAIVKRETLNQLAIDIGINKVLKIDKSVRFKNGSSIDLYGNALEAFIGALYLDKGHQYTRNYLIYKLLKKYTNIDQIESDDSNYKGKLLELAQKNEMEMKFEVHESGPKDNPVYDAIVYVNEIEIGRGSGGKKKKAEQKAAKEAFLKLNSK
ncbi:ribonuclease III [Bacteroidota bacterium]